MKTQYKLYKVAISDFINNSGKIEDWLNKNANTWKILSAVWSATSVVFILVRER